MQCQRFTAAETGAEHEHNERLQPVTSSRFQEAPNLLQGQIAGFVPFDGWTPDGSGHVAAYEAVPCGDL